ncbi:MAG: hypothetical protein RBS39_04335 [Phycisphaerales bacterium]|jgi:hypothetical protein|nr:hypothetical protein [Phycisphaerales bacterium]
MSHNEPHYLPAEHPHADAWHRHSSEEGMPQSEHAARINPYGLYLGVFGILGFVVVSVVIVAVYFQSYVSTYRAEKQESVNVSEDYVAMRARADATLANYQWIDMREGVVSLPIDVAMDNVIEKYAGSAHTDARAGGAN